MKNMLIVDDKQHIREDLARELRCHYSVHTASSMQEGIDIVDNFLFDCAIIDLKLDYRSKFGGMEIFNKIKNCQPNTKIIIISGFDFQIIKGDLLKKVKEGCEFELESCYVYKGGEQDYIEAILEKLNLQSCVIPWYGNYHALLIAAQEYRKDSGYCVLNYPVFDIDQIKECLKKGYIFREESIHSLINPSREKIIHELCTLSDKLTINDNLLIFYAGHGYRDEKNNKGYWIPCDAGKNSPHNWMSNADVVNWIARINAKHKLIISDSCFSGTFSYENRGQELSEYEEIYKHRSFKFLSATDDLQKALDRSIFLDCFLNYLKNTEKKIFSAYDIYATIAQDVEIKTNNLGKKQSPQYRKLSVAHHDNGDDDDGHFLFIKK